MTKKLLIGITSIILTFILVYLSYFHDRTNFELFIALIALAFGNYLLLTHSFKTYQNTFLLIGIAIVLRLILLLALPNLSEDYTRFFWDGKLLVEGYNPYLYTPNEVMESSEMQAKGFTQEKFQELSDLSKKHYTIYPPVNQLFFAISNLFFPNNTYGFVIILRLLIIACEIGTIFLLISILKRYGLPVHWSAWYTFNPLVILELTGNLHFEAVVIFFLILSLWFIAKKNLLTSQDIFLGALFFSLSVSSKLIPLIFIPFLWTRLGFKKGFWFSAGVGFFTLLTFLPFLHPDLIFKFWDSLDLYFQKFEFNASIYYIVRYIGYQVHGHNIIAVAGATLSIISALLALILSFIPIKGQNTGPNWATRMIFILSIYYFLATTVHPWYPLVILALSTLTPYRFLVLWSGMITLSYFAYSNTDYQENLWLVGLEYLTVWGYLIYEVTKKKPSITNS